MTLFYSPSCRGFLDDAVHQALPADAVAISPARHRQLLLAQGEGKQIVFDEAKALPVTYEPLIADRRTAALALIRAEAGRRIVALTPLWRQLNDVAFLQAMYDRATPLTEPERAEQLACWNRRADIDQIRTASNVLEAAVQTMTVAQLKALDPSDDAHWTPAAPVEPEA